MQGRDLRHDRKESVVLLLKVGDVAGIRHRHRFFKMGDGDSEILKHTVQVVGIRTCRAKDLIEGKDIRAAPELSLSEELGTGCERGRCPQGGVAWEKLGGHECRERDGGREERPEWVRVRVRSIRKEREPAAASYAC